jgi:hypothetical protein
VQYIVYREIVSIDIYKTAAVQGIYKSFTTQNTEHSQGSNRTGHAAICTHCAVPALAAGAGGRGGAEREPREVPWRELIAIAYILHRRAV